MPKKKLDRIIRTCKHPNCENTFECLPSHTKEYCSKKCANNDPIIKDKQLKSQQKVWDEKYNGHHPMQTDEVKNNHKKSMRDKYGVDHALQLDEFQKKSDLSKLERYGALNNIEKTKQTKLQRYGNEFFNGHGKRTERKYLDIVNEWKHLIPMFSRDEFTGVSNGQMYTFKCMTCEHEFVVNLDNGYIPHCRYCNSNTTPNTQSRGEKQLIEFIRDELKVTVIEKNRTILHGREIDIYLPDFKIGIEFNGIYWHSESKRGKSYHIHKTKLAAMAGITLLHIYDYQWYQKQDIVKSMIVAKLQKSKKIFARKCTIKPVNSVNKKEFLKRTHIQGNCNSSTNLGLYNDNKLVAIMTFGKSRYDKSIDVELLRYSSDINTIIIGGFSKLLKNYIETFSPKSIISYCDRDTSIGNVYRQNGFDLTSITKPNYFYFKQNSIFSREQFQKHKLKNKLEIFNDTLTEYENMKLNGFDRVWNCGNYKFLKKIN